MAMPYCINNVKVNISMSLKVINIDTIYQKGKDTAVGYLHAQLAKPFFCDLPRPSITSHEYIEDGKYPEVVYSRNAANSLVGKGPSFPRYKKFIFITLVACFVNVSLAIDSSLVPFSLG